MKKKSIGAILFWAITLAHPGQAAFGGFHVGGILGVQLLQGRHWYTSHPSSPETDMVHRLSSISALYGAHAGYLLELSGSKIVVGGEVYAFLPQAKPKINLALVNGPQEGNVTINHTRSIGIALTAGMMLNPKVLVYLSGGLEQARFKFTYSFNPIPGAFPQLPPEQVLNHTFRAINVAIGGTYKISPHLLASLELSSPFFKRFKARIAEPRAYHYKPVERRLALKLTFLF